MSQLDLVAQQINKNYKTELITKGVKPYNYRRIRFSSPKLNYMTYGGIPIGKGTELLGLEGGGKTTTALDLVANAQRQFNEEFENELNTMTVRLSSLEEKNNKSDQQEIKKLREQINTLSTRGPKQVAYVDAENTLDLDWAVKLGVDIEEMYLIKPENQTAEQVLQIMLDLIDSGEIGMMVLDSIPHLVSQKLLKKTVEDKAYGGIADAMSQFCARVAPKLTKHQTALVMINQIREDLDNSYNQFHTPGGRFLKHFYSLRLYCRRGSFIDNRYEELPQRAVDPVGNIVDVTVVKTKVFKPDRRVGSYTLNYTTGIDVVADTAFVAQHYGYIRQQGAWFQIIDPSTGEIMQNGEEGELKFQGKANLYAYLHDDEELFKELWEGVNLKVAEA